MSTPSRIARGKSTVDTYSPSLEDLSVDLVRQDTAVSEDLRERGRGESDESGEREHLLCWLLVSSLRRVRGGSRACRPPRPPHGGLYPSPQCRPMLRLVSPTVCVSEQVPRPMSRVPAGGLPWCLASSARRPTRAPRHGTSSRTPRVLLPPLPRIFSGWGVTDAPPLNYEDA